MKRLKEIDLLKGFAIISVILIHTIPVDIRTLTFAQLHFWQAVPIFVVLIGITNGLSLREKKLNHLDRLILEITFLKKLKGSFFQAFFFLSFLFFIFS